MHLFAFDYAYAVVFCVCYYIKMKNNDIKIIAKLVWHFTYVVCMCMYYHHVFVYTFLIIHYFTRQFYHYSHSFSSIHIGPGRNFSTIEIPSVLEVSNNLSCPFGSVHGSGFVCQRWIKIMQTIFEIVTLPKLVDT